MSTLDAAQITHYAPEISLQLHACVESTQAIAHTLAALGERGPTAIFADEQTAGRGQRGRRWHSPPNAAIYLTLLWPSTRRLAELSGLSLALGLAVHSVLADLGIKAEVKWPNDVLVNGRKIAGILVEILSDPRGSIQLIGIGLNIDLHPEDARSIDQANTDMCTHLPDCPSRSEIAGRLLRAASARLRAFESSGLQSMLAEWHAADALAGADVNWTIGESIQRATVIGIDEVGRLRVTLHGVERLIVAGDVQVRRAH